MANAYEFLKSEIQVINIGLSSFAENLESLGVKYTHVAWQPPAYGDVRLVKHLTSLEEHLDSIGSANQEALQKVLEAQPVWTDVGSALDTIPGFKRTTILHAGPPIDWEKMCGPMRGAIIGALIFEGLAKDPEDAAKVAGSGEIDFSPCHHYAAVGPMAGVISASMPVIVVENKTCGNRAYSHFNNEGGKGTALSFGHFGPEAQRNLRWQRDVLGPVLRSAVRELGGVDLKAIIAKALQMGDECHNRHVAATSLLVRTLLPALARIGTDYQHLAQIAELIGRNDWFFLNFSMAACKATMDAASNIPWSTMVTAMARNGVEVGIRVSGLGDRWFTAPAPMVRGLFFSGYSETDANPDLGDSAITESAGIGAFAMAAAPAMIRLVGGSVADAFRYTREMGEITLGTNPTYTIPNIDFQGTPTGIDIRKVIETVLAPVINTGIAHKEAGIGQIGAGMANIPMECFEKALEAFSNRYSSSDNVKG